MSGGGRRRWSLRRRLVLLVAVIASLVIATGAFASTVALRETLIAQLDARLATTATIGSERSGMGPGGPGGPRQQEDGSGSGGPRQEEDESGTPTAPRMEGLFSTGMEVGTVQYLEGETVTAGGLVDATYQVALLTDAQVTALREVPTDGEAHPLNLPDLGDYRALASAGGRWNLHVTALPLQPVEAALAEYALKQALIGLAGIAAVAGLAAWAIRHELRPLREVAATATRVAAVPMDRGAVRLGERVADDDPATEVGQVGAALNTLLGHVETSLAARHDSETRVRQFVADASHELRTPLASIAGYTELLRTRDLPPEEARTALARIAGESARMGALVEDMLLLARLDAGRPLERGEVDLAALAADAVMDTHAAGREHAWRLDVPAGAGGEVDVDAWTVTGDEGRLRQVFANLLTNARVHTPAGTAVTVTLREEAGDVVVTVADDGPGIPERFRGRVFDRFARGDGARGRAEAANGATGRAGSSGLGLAIVRAIVDAHGGTIAVDSSEEGTAFTIRLPRT